MLRLRPLDPSLGATMKGAFAKVLGRDLPDPLLTFAACALELGISAEEIRELRLGEVVALIRIVRSRAESAPLLEVGR
jgi:hypothetical protein